MSTYTPRSVYYISPWYRRENEIDLTEIASRVYGKPFDILRSVQMMNDNIGNGTHVLVSLARDDDYEQALYDADEKRVYLGFDRDTMTGIYHEGHTYIEYWQSVRWAGLDGLTDADATVPHNPPDSMDCYGAIFPGDADFAQRHVSPPLNYILADLIRRGEIPQGDFLIDHSW